MKRLKNFFAGLICASIILMQLPCIHAGAAEYSDYVYFGSYPQTEVQESQALLNAPYKDNVAEVNGETYCRVSVNGAYHYYRYEPICWEVVSEENGVTTLLSRYVIDCKPFDEQEDQSVVNGLYDIHYADECVWADSSLRTFLNDSTGFLYTAFSESERNAILLTETDGASDKVFLASSDDIKEFYPNEGDRRKASTDYAKQLGASDSGGYSSYSLIDNWRLYSVSGWTVYEGYVNTVTYTGSLNRERVNAEDLGVVPCIKVSSEILGTSFTEENTAVLYSPYNSVISVPVSETADYLAAGWYQTYAEATQHTVQVEDTNFSKFNIGARLSGWSGRTYTSPVRNAGFEQIISDIYTLQKNIATGKQQDYVSFTLHYDYDANTSLESLDELCEKINIAWSMHGELISSHCSPQWMEDSAGNVISRSLNIKIEANGQTGSPEKSTLYFDQLDELVAGARNASSTQRGQLDYFKRWLANNVEYLGNNIANTPINVLVTRKAVCGSYANAVNEFCRLIGIPCFVVSNTEMNHAWNCLYLDGKWYEYDATGISDENEDPIIADGIKYFSSSSGLKTYSAYGTNSSDVLNSEELDFLERTLLQDRIFVYLNGTALAFDQEPFIENGTTLVPLRVIFESLGATVDWDNDTRTVTAVKGNTTVQLTIGSNVLYKNGQSIALNAPARIEGTRTMVPVRAIAEAFGCDVDWDSATRSVIITT